MEQHRDDSALTTIPFAGFYDSWHSDEIDQSLEQMFADENGDRIPMFDDVWEEVDYSATESQSMVPLVLRSFLQSHLTSIEPALQGSLASAQSKSG